MFGSKILEVAIGIIFIYLLTSVICSAIREGIEGWLKTRSAYLEFGIRELLHDKQARGIANSFFNHPLIYSLYAEDYKPDVTGKRPKILASGKNLPSYIPSKNFALALMDIAARGPDTDAVSSDPAAPPISLSSIRLNILNLKNEKVQRAVLIALDSAEGDLNKAQANIEAWYDSSMDRVSGWYKRSTQWVIFWIALCVAFAFNINTITIADFLYRNDAVRTAVVARAEAAAKDSSILKNANYAAAKNELDSLNLPIGWTEGWGSPRRSYEHKGTEVWNDMIAPILGLLLTALAATMGAPFWFDMLNKVTVIRFTVKPHEKSQEEASEDRQLPAAQKIAITGVEHEDKKKKTDDDDVGAHQALSYSLEKPQSPRDNESNLDGCDVEVESITIDEDLPASEGGVA